MVSMGSCSVSGEGSGSGFFPHDASVNANTKIAKPGENYIIDSSTPIIYANAEKTKVKMSNCGINVNYSGYWNVYTGYKIKPKYTIYSKKYGFFLEEGVDFKAEYSNNIKPGYGEIKVTGINGNTGTKTFKFKIKPPMQEISAWVNESGTIEVHFSKTDEYLPEVEIQISLRPEFNYTPELKTFSDGKNRKKSFIYLPSSWKDPETVYIRARYVANGINGDWSYSKTLKLKS